MRVIPSIQYAESSSQNPHEFGRPFFQPSTPPSLELPIWWCPEWKTPASLSLMWAKGACSGDPRPSRPDRAQSLIQPLGRTDPHWSGASPNGTAGAFTRRWSPVAVLLAVLPSSTAW